MRRVLILSWTLLGLLFTPLMLRAEADSNTEQGTGELWLEGPSGKIPAPLLDTRVELNISGLIARAVVRQTFHNPSDQWVEGSYAFPLPADAAVDHLRMIIGQRIIEGQIQEREQAKRTYEAARQAGKRASLVQQHRPNLFSTRLANIGPGERIIVEIEYQQAVNFADGSFGLRVPLAIGPRYQPATTTHYQVRGDGWGNQAAERDPALPHINFDPFAELPLALHVTLDAGMPLEELQSPSHHLQQTRLGDGRYQLSLADPKTILDRDFRLVWKPAVSSIPRAALFQEHRGDADYLQLMLVPPASAQAERIPRDVTFVLDVSGSMHGDSIVQARAAVEKALTQLEDDDRFNIVIFNDKTYQLWTGLQPASRNNRVIAREYVRGLQANGGTEMAPALQTALQEQGRPDHVRQVIFLTDGSVSNEANLLQQIRQQIGEARLFTIGIGSAPNGYFMQTAATEGRGTYTYIASLQEVEQQMTGLFNKLRHPVLSDIQVHWPGAARVDAYPHPIPDLYEGEPLRLVARGQQLSGDLLVTGRRGDTPWQASLSLDGAKQHAGVGVAWARARIKSLLHDYPQSSDQARIRQDVIDTAMTHHLVSRFTSLVAVDVTPARLREQLLHERAVAQNLPKGWSYQKVFGHLPKTASPALLWLLLGASGLLLALLTRRRRAAV